MKARQGIRFLRPAVVVFSSVVTFALGSNNSTIIDTFLGYKSEVVFINSTSTPDVADISSHQNISEELTCPKGYFATAGVGIFRRADDTLVGSGFICRNPDGGAKRKLVSKLPAEDEYEKVARCATPKNSSTELAVEDYLTGAVVEISNFSGQQQLQTWMPTCNFGLGPSPSYQANSSDSYQASQAQVCSENTYVSALVLRKRNGEIEGMSIKCTDATSQLFSSIAAKHSSTPDSYLARLQDVGSGPEYMNCPSQSFLSGFKVWRSSEQVSGMQLRCTDESTGMSNFLQASGETHGIASEIFCWSGQKVISILAELHRFHVIRSFAVSCTDGRTLKMPEFSRKSMRSAYTKCAKSTYVAGVIASIGQDGYVDMQLHCAKTSRGASDMMGVLNENYEGPQTVLFDSSPLQLELADLSILDLPPETADNEVYTDQVENLPCPKDFYASAVICTFKGVEKDILSLGIVCLHPYSKEKRTILSKSGKNEDMFDISTRCAVLDSAHSVTDHFLKGFSTSINMNSGLSRLEMISCICDHGKQSVPLGSQQNSPLSKMDSCPEGQYIQQISVGKTPTAMLVTGLNFTCATPTDLLRSSMQVQVPDNYLVHSRPKEIVAEIYTENELLCPVGSFGTGSNTWLGPGGANAIQLICSEKESGKKKYSKIAGSPIGRVDQSNCNSAGYLQGLLGVYSPDLIGFACTCSGGATTLTFGSTTSSQVPDAMLCAEERYFSGLVVKFGATGIVDLLGRCSKEAGSIASVSFGEDSNFAQFYNPPQPYDDNYVPDSCTITDYECQTRVAAGFAVRFGFVGLVSVQTALANSGETPQCYFPQPSPPDLGRISTSIATGQDIDSIPEVVLSEQEKMKHLKEYCGTMQISSSNNGCIWKVRDLLRVLWKEGVYLLSVGVPVEAAFSLYVHGTHLAWNRANCSPEGNLTYIPIPGTLTWSFLHSRSNEAFMGSLLKFF